MPGPQPASSVAFSMAFSEPRTFTVQASPFNVETGRSALRIFLSRHLRHHQPRHFLIQPANAVAANDEVGRIENVPLDEIEHRAIDLRPLGLHQVEHEGWRILHGRIALMPVMRQSLWQRAQFALALGDVTRCN